jgi:XTP/dITP diphosphohydrolase
MIELPEDTLVVASHNEGKIKEIESLISSYGIKTISSKELSLSEPEETENTFIGNAKLKAEAAAKESGLVCLADDSGFCVDALNGDPGVYSARWAGPERNFDQAMLKIHDLVKDQGNKAASFVCVLVLSFPDGRTKEFEGRVEGDLVWPPRGDGGFGYDPIFLPKGHELTFAEMSFEEKQLISHRAIALNSFVKECFS